EGAGRAVESRAVADVRPFRALRYQPLAGHLDELVAPPYDVIGADERRALQERSPHNAVRLELPDPPYEAVADVVAQWREAGILAPAERPGIVAWKQSFTMDGATAERRTLLATVALAPYEDRVVRPHERTHRGPKEDRLRLYRAVRLHVSPVFGVYPDPQGAAWAAAGVAGEPDSVMITDGGQVEHRVWWIDDPARLQAVAAALADRWILIADGHHRYETALAYQAERRAAEGDPAGAQPYDSVLMGLTALDDPGLVVLPTHRVLTEWPEGAAGRLRAEPLADLDALLAALAAAPQEAAALGLVRPDGFALLTADLPESASPAERLDVAVLEREVLVPDLGDDQAALTGRGVLSYVKDAREAAALVADGRAAAAVLLRPIPKTAVAAVSDAGETMPQKSTYFFPKLLTGVAFHDLDG
ncbi:MAG TPA: DUF1015 domain-containing protein, partial [Miltoncostaeaceae bacterium]|nr:DUF1015 domain-containing protein [Miltoncostaeaceae bacterium]